VASTIAFVRRLWIMRDEQVRLSTSKPRWPRVEAVLAQHLDVTKEAVIGLARVANKAVTARGAA